MQISEQCGSEGWVDGSLQAVAREGEFCFIALEDFENRGADAGEVQRWEFLPRSATTDRSPSPPLGGRRFP